MMKMEILEGSEFPLSTDQTIVTKGKRTKRPRPSSSASSSGAAAAAELHNSPVYSSPTTSSGISISTDEDQDMANCLILLAHGNSPPENKPSSRRFTEMATTATGKVGIYVYECKTCNRTFRSFQALGGHRASHKRPKPTLESDLKNSEAADNHEEDEKQFKKLIRHSSLSNKNCLINDHQAKPKIHECSVCGSEFASGQALGGHMRRHRAAAPVASIDNDTSSSRDVINEKPRNMVGLDFDLNLPAPPEDDDKFHQFSPKQRHRMVFSAAAMVDCHY